MVKTNTRQKALYSLLLISTLGILLNIQPALAVNFNGYRLLDLQACDKEDFWEEAKEWTASKLINKKVIISECDGELLLGGYNVLGDSHSSSNEYFQRTYKNLDFPKHTAIYFTASFTLIDGWDADEDAIKIYINDEKLERLQFSQKDFPSNKCGGPGKDLTDVYVVAKVAHCDDYLTIKIVSDTKKSCDEASFGFRDISILFVDLHQKEIKNEICASASVPLCKDQCICPKGTFLSETKGSLTSWAGKKCLPVDCHCASGFGPNDCDCYECAKGTYFDGKSCVDCHPKCEECTGSGPDKCIRYKHKLCHKGLHFWKESEADEKCVKDCPEGWKCDQDRHGNDVCVPRCDLKDEENTWFGEINKCVCECPKGWRTEIMNKVPVCIQVCRKDEFWWEEGCEGGACVEKCPEGWECAEDQKTGLDYCQRKCCDEEKDTWFEEKGECVCECPDGWEREKMNDVYVCSHACKECQFWWEEGSKHGACVDKCPEGWKCDKGCEGVDICSPRCDRNCDENIWFEEKNECVCECPDGWETEKVNDVLVCVESCDNGEFWWKGKGNHGACVCECPEGWKCDKGCGGVDLCSPRCDPECHENIWFQEKNECVCECPKGWRSEKVNDVHVCVHACECEQFWWEECGNDGACVCECPEGWKCDKGCEGVDICSPRCDQNCNENIWFQEKHECVCECPLGWRSEKVNDVPVCVQVCEKDQFFWEEGGHNGACVCECPEGWKCDKGCEGVDICTPKCDPHCNENIWFEDKHECVCECPRGWRSEKVNDVLVCVHVCDEGQYWWEDGNKGGACVCECPEGWKCDKGCEGVDICSPRCDPNCEENIWFEEKRECVCECPDGWEREKVNDVHVCVPACEKNQFFWEEGGKHGACVNKCPEGWRCDKGCEGIDICSPQCDPHCDENIWFEEKGECVCECPDGWEKEKVNEVQTCQLACKEGQFWWGEGGKHGACVCECPEGWKCDKGCERVDICTPRCDPHCEENIWFQEKGECVCECPSGWRKEKVNDVLVCVQSCDKGQFWWDECGKDGACVCECPEGWKCDKGCEGVDICTPHCDPHCEENIWFDEKHECVCECPRGWRTEKVNDVPVCVQACGCDQFWWDECGKDGACVEKCPEGWTCGKGHNGIDICVPQCDRRDHDNIWFQEKGECVCECPAGWEKEIVNEVFVCSHACECGQFFWEDCGKGSACVDKCPDGWKCDKGCEGVDICVPKCDPNCNENIWFQEKGECVCECPDGWEKERINDVDACVKACDECQYWWEAGSKHGACVEKCPEGWRCDKGCEGVDICSPICDPNCNENIWFQEKGECVCECPEGWEKEKVNDVNVCVHSCEKGQFFWEEGGKHGACVEKCPDGWKCDKGCEGVDICSPICDPHCNENIWFQEKGECVCECPAGWRKDKVNDVPACVKSCDKGEFWWQECGADGACVCECPEGWKCDKGCEGVDICTPKCDPSCNENIWFQEKGECVCECPDGWRTEKLNDVPVCIHVCDDGEFWWEKGGKDGACVCECPDGWKCGEGCAGVAVCEPQCDRKDEENIWFKEECKCVCECPPGWSREKVNAVHVCKKGCYNGQYFWEEGGKHGVCVDECPNGWECGEDDNGLNICKPKCDERSKDKVWFEERGKCVHKCPDDFEVDIVNKVPACVPCH